MAVVVEAAAAVVEAAVGAVVAAVEAVEAPVLVKALLEAAAPPAAAAKAAAAVGAAAAAIVEAVAHLVQVLPAQAVLPALQVPVPVLQCKSWLDTCDWITPSANNIITEDQYPAVLQKEAPVPRAATVEVDTMAVVPQFLIDLAVEAHLASFPLF